MQGAGGGINNGYGVLDGYSSGATQGVLHIQMCHFTDNTAGRSGGGVYANIHPLTTHKGALTIISSAFLANLAGNLGGGVYTSSTDSLTISGSTFSANCAKEVRTSNHMCLCMLRL